MIGIQSIAGEISTSDTEEKNVNANGNIHVGIVKGSHMNSSLKSLII